MLWSWLGLHYSSLISALDHNPLVGIPTVLITAAACLVAVVGALFVEYIFDLDPARKQIAINLYIFAAFSFASSFLLDTAIAHEYLVIFSAGTLALVCVIGIARSSAAAYRSKPLARWSIATGFGLMGSVSAMIVTDSHSYFYGDRQIVECLLLADTAALVALGATALFMYALATRDEEGMPHIDDEQMNVLHLPRFVVPPASLVSKTTHINQATDNQDSWNKQDEAAWHALAARTKGLLED